MSHADGPEQRRAEFEESFRKGMWDHDAEADAADERRDEEWALEQQS